MKIVRMIAVGVLLLMVAASCSKKSVFTDEVEKIKVSDFDTVINGGTVSLYTLVGENGIGVKVTNYGARVVALCVPDAEGNPVDVVGGMNSIEGYFVPSVLYFAPILGRSANRIAGGKFTLNGEDYQFAINNGPNHLHGGPNGFHVQVWDVEQISQSKLKLSYFSKDGEENYPGNLQVEVMYELTPENGLRIEYSASTDKTTLCNLTSHAYFNLSGEAAPTAMDHLLYLDADAFTPMDSTSIPTGEIRPVDGTPFDFREYTVIGDRIEDDNQQLKYGSGYDHNWVFNERDGNKPQASLISPLTKIQMDMYTDQPGVQVYTNNFSDGTAEGKSGVKYERRSSVCLEAQHFPDAPNHANFKSTVLEPGEEYKQITEYRFGIAE